MESSTSRQLVNLLGIATSAGLLIVIPENQFLEIVFQWVPNSGTIFDRGGIQWGSLAQKTPYGYGGSKEGGNSTEVQQSELYGHCQEPHISCKY